MNWRRPYFRSFPFVGKTSAAIVAATIQAVAAYAEPSTVTNIFKPLSTPAESIYQSAILVLVICAAIFLVVGGLLAYTVVRFRHRPEDQNREPPQIYGSHQIAMAWTVIPVLIVFVVLLVTARTIYDVQGAAKPPDAIDVTVVGHQWWGEIRSPQLGIVTANELHVPVSDSSKRRVTDFPPPLM